MARMGAPPQVLGRVLSHSPGAGMAGVLGVYNRHSYDREARAALERWAEHVMALVGSEATKAVELR